MLIGQKDFAPSGAGIGKKGNDKYAALQQRQNVMGFCPDGADKAVKKRCDSLMKRRMKRRCQANYGNSSLNRHTFLEGGRYI